MSQLESSNIVYVVDSDDSDDSIGKSLAALLGAYSIEVRTFSDAESFLAAVPTVDLEIGCLLIEERLTGLRGVSWLRKLRAQGHNLPIILLTSAVDTNARRQALEAGATDVLEKPLINAFLTERLIKLLPGRESSSATPSRVIQLRDGTPMFIRMMGPEDADLEQAFVRVLSDRSKYLRFFSGIKELSPQLLKRFINPHYPESYAPIATVHDGTQETIIAVARYAVLETSNCAEFAVVVADEWQGFGIANMLMRGLTLAAAIAGVQCLEGLVLKENQHMLQLSSDLGFTVSPYAGDASILRVIKQLRGPKRSG